MKSFSYFNKEKSLKIVRARSSNDEIKQLGNFDGFLEKRDINGRNSIEKYAKSKSHSSRSKSLKSYYSKGSKKVKFEKLEDMDKKIA
jgi:hypothetical protein